jgi:hypothetical protein
MIVLDIVTVLVLMTRPVEMRMLVRMFVIVFVLCVRMLVDGPVGVPVFGALAHVNDFDPPKCRPTHSSR